MEYKMMSLRNMKKMNSAFEFFFLCQKQNASPCTLGSGPSWGLRWLRRPGTEWEWEGGEGVVWTFEAKGFFSTSSLKQSRIMNVSGNTIWIILFQEAFFRSTEWVILFGILAKDMLNSCKSGIWGIWEISFLWPPFWWTSGTNRGTLSTMFVNLIQRSNVSPMFVSSVNMRSNQLNAVRSDWFEVK